ncbi:MAG: FapA family protein [Candidatus Metalachnospira sp.]|nr:FapA family protein [Candidatus Metalachnospira sp.]
MADTSIEPFEKSILPPQPIDAVAKVTVSNDKLRAYLYIVPPENGGKEVSLGLIYNAINKNKITFGIIKEALLDISQNHIYGKDVLIAEGMSQVNGINGSYKLLFDINNDGKPKEKEDGKVDFHDLDLVKNVEEKQPLCIIGLPTEGKDGVSVYGQKILAKNGKPISSMTGKNTVLSEDGKVIAAAKSGHVTLNYGKINVNDTLYIKENVDNSTGNIRTNSSVVVTGSVLPGFSVESNGYIQIGGTISGSFIKASGNIILRNGIIGGKLECEGDLTTKFIENCDVFVKGSVKADYIMNSRIVCAKNIEAIGIISKIVGGSLIAGENIEARIIGTISYTKTYLEIGTDPTVINRQQELIKMIPDLEARIYGLQSLLSLFQQLQNANRLTEDKRQAFSDAVYSYESSSSLLQECKQELEDIKESVKIRGYGKVICSGTLYPGTTVKIGDSTMSIKTPIVNKMLFYTKEGISEALAI